MSEELKGFTPVAPDRDAILFAAGKAAARRWAGWKWLAVGLMLTNAVTLGVLIGPGSLPTAPPTAESPSPVPAEADPLPAAEPYSYIALRQDRSSPPAPDADPTVASAPLTPRAIDELRIP